MSAVITKDEIILLLKELSTAFKKEGDMLSKRARSAVDVMSSAELASEARAVRRCNRLLESAIENAEMTEERWEKLCDAVNTLGPRH